jgi:putative transcriptional regulator
MQAAILETARGLHRAGIVTDATLGKITLRHVDLSKIEKLKPPSGPEIIGLRERANMSQAVFARFLNVGTSTLSQWEREIKRPRGAAARLLAIVKARGVQAILG